MEVKRFENLPNDFSNLKNLNQASTVYLSSARKSNGINELLDNNLSLFWQSNKKADCTENHFILYEFEKLESIKYICINLNYDVDESYTPKQVVIKCGLYIEDLKVNIN